MAEKSTKVFPCAQCGYSHPFGQHGARAANAGFSKEPLRGEKLMAVARGEAVRQGPAARKADALASARAAVGKLEKAKAKKVVKAGIAQMAESYTREDQLRDGAGWGAAPPAGPPPVLGAGGEPESHPDCERCRARREKDRARKKRG